MIGSVLRRIQIDSKRSLDCRIRKLCLRTRCGLIGRRRERNARIGNGRFDSSRDAGTSTSSAASLPGYGAYTVIPARYRWDDRRNCRWSL